MLVSSRVHLISCSMASRAAAAKDRHRFDCVQCNKLLAGSGLSSCRRCAGIMQQQLRKAVATRPACSSPAPIMAGRTVRMLGLYAWQLQQGAKEHLRMIPELVYRQLTCTSTRQCLLVQQGCMLSNPNRPGQFELLVYSLVQWPLLLWCTCNLLNCLLHWPVVLTACCRYKGSPGQGYQAQRHPGLQG